MSLEALIAEHVHAAVSQAIAPLLMAQAPLRLSYTIAEAVGITGAAEHHIRTAITRGELHALKAGEGRTGRYLIPADCLSAWLHGTSQTNALKKAR